MKVTTIVILCMAFLVGFEVLFYCLGDAISGRITMGAIWLLASVNFHLLGLQEISKKNEL